MIFPSRLDYLEVMAEVIEYEIVVTAFGDATRDWARKRPRPLNFYMVGAMGHAISVATGLALALPNETVVVCEGDGGLLLNLGSLVTLAGLQIPNLKLLLFNNDEYESSGRQPLPVLMLDYEGIARSAGIQNAVTVTDVSAFREVLSEHLAISGTSFICLRVGPRPVPRDTFDLHPLQIRSEFMKGISAARDR